MDSRNITPHDLDWGISTPEGYSEKNQELLLVFNVDVTSQANIERTIVFVTGRLLWFSRQTPDGTSQKIVFDLRGQPLTLLERARKMKASILEKLAQVKSKVTVVIEILI